jgi:hypothetical protein
MAVSGAYEPRRGALAEWGVRLAAVAAAEDCARADVVVALVPLGRGRCRGPARIVGFFDLWREGGHAIWLDPVPKIASVAAYRGRRPWAPEKRSRSRR